MEIVYGEEKNIGTGLTRAAKAGQKSLVHYWHDKPNKPTNEEPLSFVLFESTFTSVSTIIKG
jgi:hypothetical protein